MRATVAIVLSLALGACAGQPSGEPPGDVIHVRNDSDRALMFSIGALLEDDPGVAVRPCGGEVSVPITAASYESDGRLMAFLAIDPSGSFDGAVAHHDGDPSDVQGTFTASILWSDGTLAGRLPLYLAVSTDMEVSAAHVPGEPAAGPCEPKY